MSNGGPADYKRVRSYKPTKYAGNYLTANYLSRLHVVVVWMQGETKRKSPCARAPAVRSRMALRFSVN